MFHDGRHTQLTFVHSILDRTTVFERRTGNTDDYGEWWCIAADGRYCGLIKFNRRSTLSLTHAAGGQCFFYTKTSDLVDPPTMRDAWAVLRALISEEKFRPSTAIETPRTLQAALDAISILSHHRHPRTQIYGALGLQGLFPSESGVTRPRAIPDPKAQYPAQLAALVKTPLDALAALFRPTGIIIIDSPEPSTPVTTKRPSWYSDAEPTSAHDIAQASRLLLDLAARHDLGDAFAPLIA